MDATLSASLSYSADVSSKIRSHVDNEKYKRQKGARASLARLDSMHPNGRCSPRSFLSRHPHTLRNLQRCFNQRFESLSFTFLSGIFSALILRFLLTEMSTGSEPDVTVEEVTGNRSFPAGKNKGKVPRRIHKAEREKLKREQLNELFLDLASALELSEPNTGKASILCETTRRLKDLLTQIESLKKDNGELESRVAVQSTPVLNVPPPEFQQPPHFPGDSFRLPAVDAAAASARRLLSLWFPFHPDHVQGLPMATSNVRKPHARYPTAADSWPSQLLGEQQIARKEVQFSGKDSVVVVTTVFLMSKATQCLPCLQGITSHVYGLRDSVLEFSVNIRRTTSMNAMEMDLGTQFLVSIQFCFHPS
ncbi:LOW QUALITY PROTEIN: transcription factor bHLH47-like isoform X1 [Populus alba x Populus x berolinensis]|nr:LOW QUALITY PROTEIN: transcription factor bHLH47-like isoform X1 [Populus alba x Populus x berolinensis]